MQEVELCVLVSLQQIPSSETADHASLPPTPPRARHRASTWESVSMDRAVSPRQPETTPRSFLGIPASSWHWSPTHRGSLPPKPKASACPDPPLWPGTGVLLPGQCLECEKYHSCFCSGRDLGDKGKKVHQGKPGSPRSFSLDPYTCFSHLHKQTKNLSPESCSPLQLASALFSSLQW